MRSQAGSGEVGSAATGMDPEAWSELVAAYGQARSALAEADEARTSLMTTPRVTPGDGAATADVEREFAASVERREAARLRVRTALETALQVMGGHLGQAFADRDDLLPHEFEQEVCASANRLRRDLDGMAQRAIGTGRFDVSFCEALAGKRIPDGAFGDDALATVREGLRQHVHVVLDADVTGILGLGEVAPRAEVADVRDATDVPDGMRRVALRIPAEDVPRTLASLASLRHYANVDATVRDPSLCAPPPKGPRTSVGDLDDLSLAGEAAFLTWATASRPDDARLASAMEAVREVLSERASLAALEF